MTNEFKTNNVTMWFADSWLFIASGSIEYSIDKHKLNVYKLFSEEWVEGLGDIENHPDATLNFFIDDGGGGRLIITMHHSQTDEFKKFITDNVL